MEYVIVMTVVFLAGLGYAVYDFIHHISSKHTH